MAGRVALAVSVQSLTNLRSSRPQSSKKNKLDPWDRVSLRETEKESGPRKATGTNGGEEKTASSGEILPHLLRPEGLLVLTDVTSAEVIFEKPINLEWFGPGGGAAAEGGVTYCVCVRACLCVRTKQKHFLICICQSGMLTQSKKKKKESRTRQQCYFKAVGGHTVRTLSFHFFSLFFFFFFKQTSDVNVRRQTFLSPHHRLPLVARGCHC